MNAVQLPEGGILCNRNTDNLINHPPDAEETSGGLAKRVYIMEVKKINLSEVVKKWQETCSQKENEATDFLWNYDNVTGPISDYIYEQADQWVDVYYNNLQTWLKEDDNAIELMERVAQEGMIDFKNYDFYKHIQVAQYIQNEESLYEGLNNKAWTLYVMKAAEFESADHEITEEQLKQLTDLADSCNYETRMYELTGEIKNILKGE